MGELKDSDIKLVAKDLIDALGMEKDSRVRREIAIGMRHPVVAKLAVANLTPILKDPEPATQIAAAEALAQAGSDAKSAAVNLAPHALERRQGRAPRRRDRARPNFPRRSTTIAETMSRMLSTETDIEMRIELATSLGLLGEKSATVIAALTRLMTDPNEDLRRRAVRTLGTFGSAAMPVANAILKIAGTEKVKDIRVDAVHAFGSALGVELKGRAKDLLPILQDREYEVRLAVVKELGALGNEIKEDAAIMKALRASPERSTRQGARGRCGCH